MKKRYNIVAVVGEYQKDGDTKKKYQTVGTFMTDDDGVTPKSIKLDTIPITPDWNGWLNVFEIKPKDGSSSKANDDDDDDDDDDDNLPF